MIYEWQYRPADEPIVAEVESGIYEQHVRVRQGDVVIDGGAQIGCFTKTVLERAGEIRR